MSGVELFTIGTMAVSLADAFAVVGTGLAAASAIGQGQAAANQAQFQSALMQRQADISRQQAERERVIGRHQEEDFRREQSRLMAQRRATLGVSGVEPGAGSPLLASEDFASEAELQAMRIRVGGETRATRLEQQAFGEETEGSLLRAQGRSARTGGFLRGGALLLQGAGTAFGRKAATVG